MGLEAEVAMEGSGAGDRGAGARGGEGVTVGKTGVLRWGKDGWWRPWALRGVRGSLRRGDRYLWDNCYIRKH